MTCIPWKKIDRVEVKVVIWELWIFDVATITFLVLKEKKIKNKLLCFHRHVCSPDYIEFDLGDCQYIQGQPI